MRITNVRLKNWRNFRNAHFPLTMRSYLLGPNASGKSNLLDVFRFLRDVSKQDGGGLQKAVNDRGGIKRLRCLHARKDPEIRIEVDLLDGPDSAPDRWSYSLAFRTETRGSRRLLVSEETVSHNHELVIGRPTSSDKHDPRLLTQTHLEQIQSNTRFRAIADFFNRITYLHLIPQMLKYGDALGGNRLEDDPFGQGFLERIANCPKGTRDRRLRRMGEALAIAVPQFRELRFNRDQMGHPHLEARYEHHRPNAGWQNETQFSDGTLRLLGLLWSLLDGESMLLLEEPELSLHEAVVENIPALIERVQRRVKNRRQVLISTHSEALLRDKSIDPQGIVVLEPGTEGSATRPLDPAEEKGIDAGLSVADVVLPKTRPDTIDQLSLL